MEALKALGTAAAICGCVLIIAGTVYLIVLAIHRFPSGDTIQSAAVPRPLRYTDYILWSITFSYTTYDDVSVRNCTQEFAWPLEPVTEKECIELVSRRFPDIKVLSAEVSNKRTITQAGMRQITD